MTSRPLSDADIKSICKWLTRPRDQALFILGLKTGFRISELLSLTIGDIKTGNGIVDFVTVKRASTKGKHKSRTVPLHPVAKEVLGIYLKVGDTTSKVGTDLVFPIGRKQAWRILKEAALLARVANVSTHSMRKTFGMRVYERTGKNVVAAQRALGHKSLASTGHYLSVDQDTIDRAILE